MSTDPITPLTNRLIDETSPYLRQHARNPVDWYPWGPEALERSKREDKPIFLSIGYSACHWCHVMEHESFEDPETAKLMNELFVNIKVDREERPDLDHIYMSAVQIMTQHGGWPMSVFLTPELKPFYGGTYFPPEDRHGMPSFQKILTGVSNAWTTRREEILRSANELSSALATINVDRSGGARGEPTLALVEKAVHEYAHIFDSDHGGFGGAPKFFHSMDLRVALRHGFRTGDAAALAMVTKTLDHISRGGIYDQLAGGFHRYSTDARWLAPHFEKMLYDNALLGELLVEGYLVTKNPEHARVARETFDYVLREMTSPEGGFYSTQDADSEGEEGKFYVWSKSEIDAVLGARAEYFNAVYDVSGSGNWEGKNILNRPSPGPVDPARAKELAESRAALLAVRSTRIAPARDEKVLVAWNGMMIHAMAVAHQALGDGRYYTAAARAARFILEKMTEDGTKLQHVYKDGRAKLGAYLDDYAQMVNALISLYESDFDATWLERAAALATRMRDQFWDKNSQTFYFTPRDHETLILRPKEIYDGATPSGTSMAATALLRLGKILGDAAWTALAEKVIGSSIKMLSESPTAVGQMMVALDALLAEPAEWVLVEGDSPEEFAAALEKIRRHFAPAKVQLALRKSTTTATATTSAIVETHLRGKTAVDGKTSLYVCRNFTCEAPAVGIIEIEKRLGQ